MAPYIKTEIQVELPREASRIGNLEFLGVFWNRKFYMLALPSVLV
jgi:hypothetical protein